MTLLLSFPELPIDPFQAGDRHKPFAPTQTLWTEMGGCLNSTSRYRVMARASSSSSPSSLESHTGLRLDLTK
jgi:hypothetical protein